MEFDYSERTKELAARLAAFMDEHVSQNEGRYYQEVSSGATDPSCALFIVMGKTDPGNADKHKQQSMIIVPPNSGGVTDDFGLALAYADARLLRIADGTDEVRRNQIGRLELSKYKAKPAAGLAA
jgi:alkylation response protein AidB-like acyl-CoA dehydrogenase